MIKRGSECGVRRFLEAFCKYRKSRIATEEQVLPPDGLHREFLVDAALAIGCAIIGSLWASAVRVSKRYRVLSDRQAPVRAHWAACKRPDASRKMRGLIRA